jgi:hypothetical protein
MTLFWSRRKQAIPVFTEPRKAGRRWKIVRNRSGSEEGIRKYSNSRQPMIEQGIPAKAAAAVSLEEIAALLQSFPRLGDFKAGQFTLDLNYGPHLHLPIDNFVIAGPGARNLCPQCSTGTE